jgi:hypothetical protein
MSGLDRRLRALERQARQAAGCPVCDGQMVHIVEAGERLPWLNGASYCRACGNGVKLYDREMWDRVP